MFWRHPYKISVLAIVKDEDLYLPEFICYYLAIGVDHFYFYDNDSSVPLSQTLEPYAKWCTITPWPGRGKQLQAYNHFIKHYSRQTEWVAPIDVDEFIALKKHQNIKDFIKEYSHLDCIAINWRCFGDSYLDRRPEGMVIENFTHCEDIQNPHIKNILRASAWVDCENVHYLGLKPGSKYCDVKGHPIASAFNEHPTIDVVQVNHYVTKSREECRAKYNKGRASVDEKFNLTDELLDSWRISMNLVEDTFLRDKFAQKVKALMEEKNKNGLSLSTHLLQRIRKGVF